MNYRMLRKLRDELLAKSVKTADDKALLEELESLNSILSLELSSLAVSGTNCPSCGRPLQK